MSKIDYSRIFIKEACPTTIGGQAVMEGVMMQGPDRIALAMRLPSGELYLRTKKKPVSPKVMKIPFIRGIVAFALSLVNGMSTLMESADILEQYAPEEYGEEPGKFEKWINDRFGSRAAWNFMMTSALVIAVAISILFFVILPTWVVNFAGKWISNAIVLNLIEGILRIAMFVGYILAIRNMEDIKTLFRYHGAEHKTIHCFENGLKLTPEKADIFYTLHPRCGTSFMVFVLIISLLLFSFLGWPNLFMRIMSRLLLIPVIAGISYELLKWAGRSDGKIVRILSYPGLMLQKLTTAEPTLDQLEVAILSLKAVLVDPETADIDGFVDSNGKLIKVAVEDDVPDFAFSKPKDRKKLSRRNTDTLNPEEAGAILEAAIAQSEAAADARSEESAVARSVTTAITSPGEKAVVRSEEAAVTGSEEMDITGFEEEPVVQFDYRNMPAKGSGSEISSDKEISSDTENSGADDVIVMPEHDRHGKHDRQTEYPDESPEEDYLSADPEEMGGNPEENVTSPEKDRTGPEEDGIRISAESGTENDDLASLEAELYDDFNSRLDEYIRLEDLEGIFDHETDAGEYISPDMAGSYEAHDHMSDMSGFGAISDTERDAYRSARAAGSEYDYDASDAAEKPARNRRYEEVVNAAKAERSSSAEKAVSAAELASELGADAAAIAKAADALDPAAPIELAEKAGLEEKIEEQLAEKLGIKIPKPDVSRISEGLSEGKNRIAGFFKDLFSGEKKNEEESPDMEMWMEGSPVMSNKLPQEDEQEVSEESISEAIRFLDSIDHDGYTIVTPEDNKGMTLAQSIAEHDAKQAKQRTLARRYTNDITTIENALEWGQAALSLIDNGRNEAVTIMSYATGLTRTELITRGKELMREDDFEEFDKRIQARLTGTPLQYILGMQEFMGLPFRVNPTVLIPRQDTEVMVEKAIEILSESDIPHPDVLDMCTGSGAIGISIAVKVPNAYVTMSDASEDALHTAMGNAGLNGVNRRCIFLLGDMFDALPEYKRFDMIICNPPYIESAVIDTLATEIKDHEPRMALDGGEDGLDYYRIIANHASEHLRSGGILLLEIGSKQAGSVKRLLMKSGTFKNIEKYKDLAGLDRVIIAERI